MFFVMFRHLKFGEMKIRFILRKAVTVVSAAAFCLASSPAVKAGLPPISLAQMYSYASSGNVRALRAAVQRGLNIDSVDRFGNTGLCHAILQNNCTAYNAFRSAGANPRSPCIQNIPTRQYDNFMDQSCAAAITDTPRQAYNKFNEGEFIIAKRTWIIGGILLAGGLVAILAGGGGGGGGGARRGAGETKLELDRRHVHARIDALAEKLAEMEKRRGESRKARAKTGMPVVSLVGYTNVGKSSLMNALCGPSVAEADMLFATLDPTSRKLVLPSGMAVLLVDTVGFVSRLPHNLVEAFKSTLEEAAWSDVIVRVADAGDEQREEQLAVTDEVLDGLDCTDIPRLTVYNKCDKPGALSFDPDILLTSAKTGYGLDKLLQKLDETLSDRVHTLKVLLPYDKLGLAAPMRERGSVQVEEYREDGLYLEGIVKTEDLHCFEGYLV